MFLIKLITNANTTGESTETVLGYTQTEESAIGYCNIATSKLNCCEARTSKRYIYETIRKVDINEEMSCSNTTSDDIDEILNIDSFIV